MIINLNSVVFSRSGSTFERNVICISHEQALIVGRVSCMFMMQRVQDDGNEAAQRSNFLGSLFTRTRGIDIGSRDSTVKLSEQSCI